MSEKLRSRRWFLGTGAKALGGAVVVDQLPKLAEMLDTRSSIRFLPGEKRRSESAVLVLGGVTVSDSKGLAQDLPALKQLGPVMYAHYAQTGLQIPRLAKDLLAIKEELGVEYLSIYGHSMGVQIAGAITQHVGDKFRFPMIFMDDPTPDLKDTRFNGVAQAIAGIPEYHGGTLLTEVFDIEAYHDPFAGYAAMPDLLWDQGQMLYHGKRFLPPLAAVVNRDNTIVNVLHPQDPKKDPVINFQAAERDLRPSFPHMRVFGLGGNQGHANPHQNKEEYNRVIDQAIALGGVLIR